MTLTLSNVMVRAWRELGFGFDFNATGGSTTTVVDANTKFTTTDAWKGGTAVVVRDSAGAGAAPEGEFGRVSAFSTSTNTFTIDAVSVAIASGDSIFLASPKITARQMIQAVNDGIRDLGWIGTLDTSITTADSQTEYTLPVALKSDDVLDVLLQTKLNDTNDNQYVSIKGETHVETAAAGSTGILYLPQYASGYTVKIIYNGYHPKLTIFSSTVHESIPESLAVAATIDKALTWLVSKRGESALNSALMQRLNDARQTLANSKIEHPVFRPKRQTRWFSAGGSSEYEAPVGKVRL